MVMTWTRHTERVSSRHPVLGMVGLTIACFIGCLAASDGVWPPVAFAVFLACPTPLLCTAAVFRVEVDSYAVRVRRQPVLRNPATYLGAGAVGAGLVLVVAYAGEQQVAWMAVGGAIAILGLFLSRWAWRLQPFRITEDAIVFARGVTFPFETLTATLEHGIRSDDMAQIAANRTLLGGPKRHLALRAYGIHPNTALSTIHQIQEWKRAGASVPLPTVAAMLSISDQPDVAVRDSVQFELTADSVPTRVSGPCSGQGPAASQKL